jgi:hypothetical protein
MEEFPENATSEQKLRIQESNRQELLNYLYNQFALKNLHAEEYQEFSALSVLPVVRQGRTLVDRIREQRLRLNMKEHDTGYLDRTARDHWRYSYGELLHNIYFSTRIPSSSDPSTTFYSKDFIRCILGTHSVLLNQIAYSPNNSDHMMQIIGSSVAGRWANEMLPKIAIGSAYPRYTGSLSDRISNFIDWNIPDEILYALLDLESTDNSATVRKFLEAFILIGMFYTGIPEKGLKISLQATVDSDDQPVLRLSSSSNDHICFNVMNFVLNLYNFEDYLNKIRSELHKISTELTTIFFLNWETEREIAKWLIQKASDKDNQTPYQREHLQSIKISTFQRSVKRANVWEDLLIDRNFASSSASDNTPVYIDDPKILTKRKKSYNRRICSIISNLIQDMDSEIRSWSEKYSTFTPTVLPVQHFDMMYNVIKRLANTSYHRTPVEAMAEDICDCIAVLYKNIAEELSNQDKVYLLDGDRSFANAYQDSLFYKQFAANEKEKNPFIAPFLISTLSNALINKDNRDVYGKISIPYEYSDLDNIKL